MHTNHELRRSLITQADRAFLGLMTQLDDLLKLVDFYLSRWPSVTRGDSVKEKELIHTVVLLSAVPGHLAEIIRQWKNNEERKMSPMTAELVVLNELWANIQALIYFFVSHEISLDPFDQDVAGLHFANLIRCNRLLT